MLNGIFNQTNLLEKGLDAAWKKNEVIANNIANSDTVNFKASHAEFESVFRDILGTDTGSFFSTEETDSSSVSSKDMIQEFNQIFENATYASSAYGDNSSITNEKLSSFLTDDTLPVNIAQDKDTAQLNRNSVDLDSEMSELAQNSILYNTLSYSVNKELARIKTVLNEGR